MGLGGAREAGDPVFRRAEPLPVRLAPPCMSELDQPADLVDGKGWEALLYLLDAVVELIAIDYRIRHDTRAPHHGAARGLARHLLNQLTLRSIHIQSCIETRLLHPILDG